MNSMRFHKKGVYIYMYTIALYIHIISIYQIMFEYVHLLAGAPGHMEMMQLLRYADAAPRLFRVENVENCCVCCKKTCTTTNQSMRGPKTRELGLF